MLTLRLYLTKSDLAREEGRNNYCYIFFYYYYYYEVQQAITVLTDTGYNTKQGTTKYVLV